MIQLSNRNKIIILLITVLLIVSLLILLIIKNKRPAVSPTTNNLATQTVREMTREEKIKVHIDPNLEAEVLNDKDGLYIYRIKK